MRYPFAPVFKILLAVSMSGFLSPSSGLARGREAEMGKGGQVQAAGQKRPVLVIPGMFASFDTSCFFKVLLLCGEGDEWGWFPVLGETVYDSLLDFLRQNGYTEENGLLRVFFYDWRRPVRENVSLLKGAIAGFKGETGAAQVDLIGHSMGGLLGRAYIQDESYSGDVAHLVTIGSPHTGAAKVYPYFQAAYIYEANFLEEVVMGLLLEYVRVRELQPIPVLALRSYVPSMQNLLPTWDYLYQNQDGSNQLEQAMVHRNNYLPELNEDVGLLYERLGPNGLATIAGTKAATTERFYVEPYYWWWDPTPSLWWAWDDGVPDWARWAAGDFYDPEQAGDGTVLVKSALLAAPANQVIVGGQAAGDVVDHLEVVEDPRTLFAIADFLQLPFSPETLSPGLARVLMLYVDGPVEASLTDPLGRSLAAPGLAPAGAASNPVPNGEYLLVPGETFQLILIPEPVEGAYEVEILSLAEGVFHIGLMDTFDPPEQTSADPAEEWYTSASQAEAGTKTHFIILYTPGTGEVKLLAETPLIEAPLYAGNQVVRGRSMPGAAVEIRDAGDGSVLGKSTAGSDGLYSASLEARLTLGQRIYPSANGVDGPPVEALGRYQFLPGVLNSP